MEVDPDDREAFNYEIATIGIDGTSPERLTRNGHYDHYPVWSPDGTRIAFVESPYLDRPDKIRLSTVLADGSDRSETLTPPTLRVGFYPPTWSPDGRRLAFIAEGGILYAVRADGGSEPNRLYETTALPSWSPDGSRIAFADKYGIHTVRPDRTDLVQVWAKGKADPSISQVSWSPDGSELLFVAADERHDFGLVGEGEGIFVVGADGSGLRHLPFTRFYAWPWPPAWAEWSPDGLRIAVYGMGTRFGRGFWHPSLLLTMARDGTDVRFLANVYAGSDGGYEGDGRFHAWSPPRSEEPDLAACSQGFVVKEPESNDGLVHECETLLRIRDALAGSAELDWNNNLTMNAWEGVTVGGPPPPPPVCMSLRCAA